MVDRAVVEFVTRWLWENLDAGPGPDSEAVLIEALAVQLEIDARLAGLTGEQVAAVMGPLPDLIADARRGLAAVKDSRTR